jgi:4-hydroxybenzoyl-CoA thioesterase
VTEPFVVVHHVRFDEVDAAGIVYFGRFFSFCHDAMAAMFGGVEGGYAGLVNARRLGFPAVHAEADYVAPLRFGDAVRIAATVERLGTSSIALRFELTRLAPEAGSPGERVATLRHVVVATDLTAMRSRPLPDEVRAALARWLTPVARPPATTPPGT